MDEDKTSNQQQDVEGEGRNMYAAVAVDYKP
jgi:hypothetical protein